MEKVIIIGAGIIGSVVARELSRYNCNIIVLEKENDVACGTSKANSGLIHAGFDAENQSLKAKYNVIGSKIYPRLAKELDFSYQQNGALVLAFSQDEIHQLQNLYNNGLKNGVKNLQVLNKEEVLALEKNISNNILGALYAPTAAIISPYETVIAFAEAAANNGVKFLFNHYVSNIIKENEIFKVFTNKGEYKANVIINCAGVTADEINNMVCAEKLQIIPKRGEYLLLDKQPNLYTNHTIFKIPSKDSKGVLVTPTTSTNTLIGPTAHDILDKEDVATTIAGLDEVWQKAQKLIPSLNKRKLIMQFSGLRANIPGSDFIIGFSLVKGFYNIAGIASPGLSCAPAIGIKVAEDIAKYLQINKKENYIKKRKGITNLNKLNFLEKEKLIKQYPQYGNIICRCETISEGEIIEAIKRIPGAKDVDGVKRRTRAGMGRCQSGFCLLKVIDILSRELGIPYEAITKKGGDSYIIKGKVIK